MSLSCVSELNALTPVALYNYWAGKIEQKKICRFVRVILVHVVHDGFIITPRTGQFRRRFGDGG